MVEYRYAYFVGGMILLAFWIILFLWRKDLRKELIIVSLIFAVFGPFMNFIYFIDWWNPPTITNTIISPEDFLYCFALAGIAAVIYEVLYKKKLKIRNINKIMERERNIRFFYLFLILGFLFLGCFFILDFNSLLSTLIALFIPTMIIYIQRKDLILDSIASGFILLGLAFIFSSFLDLFFPNFITYLYYEHSSRFIIFNVPWWDIPFYFFAGAFIGPLYEYWQEAKLIKMKE
ncbi:hypothetical protein K9L16_01620 [Candidatus Pacearchaeota archaeon]|nr:hypothetical protein [Candidatus Pacearchaeota archaeon]